MMLPTASHQTLLFARRVPPGGRPPARGVFRSPSPSSVFSAPCPNQFASVSTLGTLSLMTGREPGRQPPRFSVESADPHRVCGTCAAVVDAVILGKNGYFGVVIFPRWKGIVKVPSMITGIIAYKAITCCSINGSHSVSIFCIKSDALHANRVRPYTCRNIIAYDNFTLCASRIEFYSIASKCRTLPQGLYVRSRCHDTTREHHSNH